MSEDKRSEKKNNRKAKVKASKISKTGDLIHVLRGYWRMLGSGVGGGGMVRKKNN